MRKQRTLFMTTPVVISLAIAVILGLLAGSAPIVAQDVKVNLVPVVYTQPDQSQKMYVTYCSPCHGLRGDGKGPAAAAFKYPPTNLTTLAKTHGGKYPEMLVISTIQMGTTVPANGSVGMPVWGDAFRHLDNTHSGTARLRIVNLTAYIRSLQK